MPRKNKKSQAQSLRWQRWNEIHCATTTEQAECVGPQSSGEGKTSTASHGQSVKQGGQHDASCVPQLSYADIVKRGRHSDDPCVAGPSHARQVNHRDQSDEPCVAAPSHADCVNRGDQPSVQHVCASRSQASRKYGKSRNQQCTCNSLTFLAFLHENENVTRADLDLVLDKGNVMYKEARKRVPNHIHLTTDELPDEVPARRYTHYVDMTQLSRYGTFGEPLTGAVDSFLDLEAGLSCLLSDVQYALLLMRALCIAVFRTRSGRYGFFDPHSRTAKGLPLPPDSRTPGTAVMLTFTHLSDMIDRLRKYHKVLGTESSCNYELKPVAFYNVKTAILNDAIPETESQPTTHTAAVSNALVDDAPQKESNPSAPKINTVVPDVTVNIVHEVPADMETEPELSSQFSLISVTSHDTPQSESNVSAPIINTVASDNVLHDISCKLSKLSKQQREKHKRRLMLSVKVSQRKENQKRKEKEKYASNETYKAKKNLTQAGNLLMKNSDKENESMIPTAIETIQNYDKRKEII